MKKPVAKCYFDGEVDELYYVEFNEWVCKKHQERLDKFFKRLKQRKTRYKNGKSFIGAHNL